MATQHSYIVNIMSYFPIYFSHFTSALFVRYVDMILQVHHF